MSSPGAVQLGGIPSTTGLPTVRGFSNTSVIGLGVPFSQNDWPNPTRPVNTALVDFIDQSIIGFVIPFNQTNWPNPRGPQPLPTNYQYSTALLPQPNPFKQSDWTNPQQPRQSSLSFSVNTAHLFTNPTPFFSKSIFDVPRGPIATEPGFVDQAIWALVIPFAQTNWPNPVTRPVAPIEFHDTFSRPPTNPFNQTNWTNPNIIPITLRSLGWVDGPIIIDTDPLSQQDWPNPGRGSQWSVAHHGFTDTYNRTVVAAPVPFVSVSTANPVFTRAIHTGVVDQAIWAFVIPFSQTDWPNPVPRQPYVIGWTDNFPNRTPPGTPFAQLDWTNPQRAVVLPFWWTDSYNRTPVAIGDPFSQKDWPNPKGPTATHAVGIIPYATVLIPLPPPPPPSTEPDWKPFLVSMGKLMGMG